MTETTITLSDAEIAAIGRRIDRPIVLVGLMGVGKSTVGRKLAALLKSDFVDADDAIEQAAKMTIPEIFEQYGEPYFRDGERRVIARLVDEQHGVIATGGGAFCDNQTRSQILESAIAIWLDSDIETLIERTSRKATRPLLKGKNPREVLERLAQERAPLYGEAPIRVMSSDGPHHETALAILEAIDRWL